jgi:hypothetical protein
MSPLVFQILGVIFIFAGFFVAVIKGSGGSDPKRTGLGVLILCLGYAMVSWGIHSMLKEGEKIREDSQNKPA